MKFIHIAAACAFAASATFAHAAGDAAAERQALMKNVGAATGAGAKMAKGEVPFDANAANLVLRTMNAGALGFGYMFPEGSESGSETEAAPAIWSDREGFNKAVAALIADTSGQVSDLESFRTAFGTATRNCGACHKAYRVKN